MSELDDRFDEMRKLHEQVIAVGNRSDVPSTDARVGLLARMRSLLADIQSALENAGTFGTWTALQLMQFEEWLRQG